MLQVRLAVSLAVLGALAACSDGEPADSPGRAEAGTVANLVLISLDTCRADRLGCYGAQRDNSPNLDQLAEESVLFSNCLTASTLTGPSHRSLFTSHHVRRHGVLKNGRPSLSPYTLAQVLRDAGWRTASFTGGGPMHEQFGLSQGFEHHEQTAAVINAHEGYLRLGAEKALAWLDQEPRQPFFLFLHGYDPHCPYTPPEECRGRYGSWYQGDFDPHGRCGKDGFEPLMQAGRFGPDEVRYLSDLYDEEVVAADRAIGGFLDALRARGLYEDTLIVFLSDHGESLGEHDWVGHARMWEEELRVPFMIRFPRGQWASRRDDPVQLTDLLPTLLSYFGLEAPAGMQGTDLMQWIRDAAAPPRERLRLARSGLTTSVRFDERWKLVFRWEQERKAFRELYDLENDPGELVNLFRTPEGRARTQQMLERLQAWLDANAAEDQAMRAVPTATWVSPEDRAGLAALGYAEGEEDDR